MTVVVHDQGTAGREIDLAATPPPPKPARRNVMVVGALLAVAAGTVLFGGLLAGYFDARDAVRLAGDPWVPDDVELPNAALFLSYLTLVMSSVTAQWAVAAIDIGDRRQVYVAMGLTLLLGFAFVNALSFCWSRLGVAAGELPFATQMYAVTVTHLVVVVIAIVTLVVVGFRVLGGQLTRGDHELAVVAVIVWHFATVAGLAVWWSIWFLEGGP